MRSLSARLGEIGRPILPSGITKIEDGTRRVDVGDLVALAEVLDVSPVTLLMPPDRDGDQWAARWRWMHAEGPLPGSEIDPEEFRRTNRPYEDPRPSAAAQSRIAEAVRTMAFGLAPGTTTLSWPVDGQTTVTVTVTITKPVEHSGGTDGR